MPPVPSAAPLTETPAVAWVVFGALVLGILVADLLIFNRRAHVQGVKEAAVWSGVWVGLALAFNAGVYFWKGRQAAVEFSTAYLVEQALSVDNLFIFLVIFKHFGVPTIFQHRVLFWGVIGAQVMRGIMIFAGVGLIALFHPILYLFAGILVITGIKLFFSKEDSFEPSNTLAFKFTRKYVRMTDKFHEEKFFVMQDGLRMATPLFLVLMIVESTDLIFAVDSIPACLSISKDPFVVYTSNIFAVMGLRAYYFLLAGAMGNLRFLKPALAIVLVFIGAKMFLHEGLDLKIDSVVSLGIVGGILGASVAVSLMFPVKAHPRPLTTLPSSADAPAGGEEPAKSEA
ncbi:MAG: TerC family protein [Planctomycetota bacterium]|nr:TerC family protein [Planctomycetota bacterium]